MTRRIGAVVAAAAALIALDGTALAQRSAIVISAALVPGEEVPALLSSASGALTGRINVEAETFEYALVYEGFETDVRQAHIHIAQPGVNGGIMVWLCDSEAIPGPGDTPTCPARGGNVTGVVTADEVQAVSGQGVREGSFEDFVTAIRQGIAYANVHSVQRPGGEIRGHVDIRPRGRLRDRDGR